MRLLIVCGLISFIFLIGCEQKKESLAQESSGSNLVNAYSSAKPGVRWWWFATKIKKEDIAHQLDWAKSKNFGAVEIAWVYPLYRYQRMYSRKYDREYPKDTSAQEWLSEEWVEMVNYTKAYADSIGLSCDFTFGSAWPVAALDLPEKYRTRIYGDSSFEQLLTFAWAWPDTMQVINHLDSNAFNYFAMPISNALNEALEGSKSAMFTDSWEIKLNAKNKIWTAGFEKRFEKTFGYDIIPYMEQGLDSFPEVRYDYMMLLGEYVQEGFYKPYVKTCRQMGAWSRVQCLASPTDVMTTYSLVDIPETECMLNNPNYSRIVSSAACLASKPIVSSETFTCMYGFPATYLREEQTADLKMVIDAMFAKGVNQHFYHGMPYNPKGSDSIDFFATTYFGPGGSLEKDLSAFNEYVAKVSSILRKGKTYSDIAVYLPYEDGIMKGAYPPERQRVWVWGEYEMRYLEIPKEVEAYHPLYINRHFLEKSSLEDGKLIVGDASFNALFADVNYMDPRALKRIAEIAKSGFPICLKKTPMQPGKNKDPEYEDLLAELEQLPNVSSDFLQVIQHKPLINGDSIPAYWCKLDKEGNYYLYLAQWEAKDLSYPIYSGQSFSRTTDSVDLKITIRGKQVEYRAIFEPYQSLFLKISSKDMNIEELDIKFTPQDPLIREQEKQKMYF